MLARAFRPSWRSGLPCFATTEGSPRRSRVYRRRIGRLHPVGGGWHVGRWWVRGLTCSHAGRWPRDASPPFQVGSQAAHRLVEQGCQGGFWIVEPGGICRMR